MHITTKGYRYVNLNSKIGKLYMSIHLIVM